MKHMGSLALSSAVAVTVMLCLHSSQASDTSTNKVQLIEMQMDNDLFLGAEDFFYEFRDVMYIDSVTPAAAKTEVQAAAPVAPQPSGKDRDSSKDKEDDAKPQTETQSSPAGSTTPPPSSPPSTDTPPEVPDAPEVPDVPDVPPDCPT